MGAPRAPIASPRAEAEQFGRLLRALRVREAAAAAAAAAAVAAARRVKRGATLAAARKRRQLRVVVQHLRHVGGGAVLERL